jgi:hypothetical protein
MEEINYIIKFKGLRFLFNIIKNDFIILNSPSKFNDPLDCYFITFFGNKLKNMPETIKEYINIAKKIKIFCGTIENNLTNVLMWSHYSENHKGVALKYKVPQTLEGKLKKVNYRKQNHEKFMKAINYERNFFDLPNPSTKTKEKNIYNTIFNKNKDWKYENEIRYIKKTDSSYEYGWKVVELFLGFKYLDNTNKKLEEIIKIVDLCFEKKIKVYTMRYSYNIGKKEMQLNNLDFDNTGFILEREYYDQIINEINDKILERKRSKH